MVKKTIPWLFEEKPAPHKTQEWYKKIRDNPKDYETCFVVSFTRVKDLNSMWKHEYVQFIVEDESQEEDAEQNNRTRVYAERGNEVALDWVTVGMNDKDEDTRRKDLPLPLTSLFFAKGNRPRLVDVAALLDKTTENGGPYRLRGHSCFWFANAMYTAVRCIQGIQGPKEKRWTKRNLGGKGGGKLDDLIALLFPEQFKDALKPTADDFTDQRNRFRYLSAGPIGPSRKPISQKVYLEKVEEAVLEPDGLEKYIEILKQNGLQMDENQIKQFLEFAKQQAEREDKQQVQDGIGKLGLDFEDFQKNVLGDPDADKLLELYNRAESQIIPEASTKDEESKDPYYNQSAESILLETTCKIFAARILVDCGLQTL